MVRYFVKKTAIGILSIIILSALVFSISHFAPGDPLKAVFGDNMERVSLQIRQEAASNLGLDKPVSVQYTIWVKNLLKGELGYSFKYSTDVKKLIGGHVPNTMRLMLTSYLIIFIFAPLMGCICAINRDSRLDRIISGINTMNSSIPVFWFSIMFILVFSTNLSILPSSGVSSIGRENDMADIIVHMIMPVSVIVICHIGYYANFIRDRILEELSEDYITYLRAKGLSSSHILKKHALKKIMPSLLSLFSVSASHIVAGSYIVEYLFSYPGIGKLMFESAKDKDYPLLMASVMLTGIIVVLISVLSDLASAYLDPRIKTRG